MSWRWTIGLVLLLGCTGIKVEPKFAINDQPIMGSFAYTWEAGDVRQALDIGVNLFFCYDRRAGGRLLDTGHEMAAMIQA